MACFRRLDPSLTYLLRGYGSGEDRELQAKGSAGQLSADYNKGH